MGIAIAAAFILPDLPHNTKGFSREELEVAQLRIIEDVGEADVDAEGQGPFDGLYMALTDPKIYVMMITFAAYVVGLSFNAFFVGIPLHPIPPILVGTYLPLTQPTLTGTLGLDYVPTLLMSSPPWLFSCIVSLIVAWSSDRSQEKVRL